MNLHFPEDALTLALIIGAIALAVPLLGWLLRVTGSLISSATAFSCWVRHGFIARSL